MDYKFPVIVNIKDVLPHLEGYDEFIVADKGSYTVIQYAVDTGDTFKVGDDPIGAYVRREFRGIKFDNKTGAIIARPFHKFFNLNQHEETMDYNIDISMIDCYMTKEDGSMIHAFKTSDSDEILFGTKMGVTDVSKQMLDDIPNLDVIKKFSNSMLILGYTPIFEYVSPINKIVLKYKEPKMILTAIRHMITGEYLDISGKGKFRIDPSYGIEVVKSFDYDSVDIGSFASNIDNMIGIEGFIIKYKNGHMFKIKTSEYVFIHKTKEQILNDRYIIKLMMEGEIDDVIPKLDEDDREHVEDVMSMYNRLYHAKQEKLLEMAKNLFDIYNGDRKQFAINEKINSIYTQFVFKYFSNPVDDTIKESLSKYCMSHMNQNIRYDELIKWLKE